MECLELTKYLECGAKIPCKYPEMCSQITSESYLWRAVHQLSPTFFSHQPPPMDGFVPRTFTPYSVKCFWELGEVCFRLPMPSLAAPAIQKSRAMGRTPPACWIPFPLPLHACFTQAVATPLKGWPNHLEAEIHQCVSSATMGLKLTC